MVVSQNGRPARLASATRTTHSPGSSFHSKTAARRPTPRAAVGAQDKELGQVELLGMGCRRRAPGHQGKARDPVTISNQKRPVRVGLRPVARQPVVSEATLAVDLDREDLAHVVQVELQQVEQDRRAVPRRKLEPEPPPKRPPRTTQPCRGAPPGCPKRRSTCTRICSSIRSAPSSLVRPPIR